MSISLLEKIVNDPLVRIGTALFAGLFAYKLVTADISQKAYAHEVQKKAVEYEGYIMVGGRGFEEGDIPEGNKSVVGTGLNITWDIERLKLRGSIEYAHMGEPDDEDIEILHNTQSISARGSYHFSKDNDFTFYPFVGVSFNRWVRHENPKYEESFSELLFSSVNLGIGAKYKNFYVEIGSSLPVWSQTDYSQSPSGEIGINWIIGFEWKIMNLGVLYEQIPFRGDDAKPSFQSELYALRVGIKF